MFWWHCEGHNEQSRTHLSSGKLSQVPGPEQDELVMSCHVMSWVLKDMSEIAIQSAEN